MLKKILGKILAATLIFLSLTASVTNASAAEPKPYSNLSTNPAPPEIKAVSAILIEARRGQILTAKEPELKLHISVASKIMTAVLVLEKAKANTQITISKASVDSEGSTLDLEVGEKYSVEDLLYALILTSANDVANALAESVAGSIEDFVLLMNNKAHELNMKNTNFRNPTGLYDEEQYTTAMDIAALMEYALNNPLFNTIFSCAARPWSTEDGVKVLTNQNELFWSYDGVDGGKMGYNNQQQQSAITTATRMGQRLICIVLDSPNNQSMLEDSAKLLDYGFKNFRTGILVSKNQAMKTLQIGGQEVNLVSKNDIFYTFPVGQSYIESVDFDIIMEMEPPVLSSRVAGIARYTLSDDTIIDISLYPDRDINLPEDFMTIAFRKLKENRDILMLLYILVIIEVFLVVFNIFKLIKKLFIKCFWNRRKSA